MFYIEYPSTIKDFFRFKSSPEFSKKKELFSKSSDGLLETDHPNLQILITPLLLSINFLPEGFLYRKILWYNERLIQKRVQKIIKKFSIKNFVYINSSNFHYPTIGKLLNAKLKVYHCVDPIVNAYDVRHGKFSEDITIKNSDLVICTSKELYKKKLQKHAHTYFVPNAANFDHSVKADAADTPVLPQLKEISRPIIGYFGNIEGRINYYLLEKVMEMNRDKSFVFVGPIADKYKRWFKVNTPNLYLIDPIPYKEMPSVLKGFDVAIIPFNKDEASENIFPLKLFEYLGSGKPVIATDFNRDLEDFTKGTVSFCRNELEFSEAIGNALIADTLEKKSQRLAIAKENTWLNRLDEFSTILQKHLENNDSES